MIKHELRKNARHYSYCLSHELFPVFEPLIHGYMAIEFFHKTSKVTFFSHTLREIVGPEILDENRSLFSVT